MLMKYIVFSVDLKDLTINPYFKTGLKCKYNLISSTSEILFCVSQAIWPLDMHFWLSIRSLNSMEQRVSGLYFVTGFLYWHHTFSVMNGFSLWCPDELFQKEAQISVPAEPIVTCCVQPCLQPMCPCQGDRHQPSAPLMSFWSPPPVSELQCDVTKTKKQYFWKSLSWVVSVELCVVSSEAAWKSISCFTESWLANSQYRLVLFCHKKPLMTK